MSWQLYFLGGYFFSTVADPVRWPNRASPQLLIWRFRPQLAWKATSESGVPSASTLRKRPESRMRVRTIVALSMHSSRGSDSAVRTDRRESPGGGGGDEGLWNRHERRA